MLKNDESERLMVAKIEYFVIVLLQHVGLDLVVCHILRNGDTPGASRIPVTVFVQLKYLSVSKQCRHSIKFVSVAMWAS